MPDEYIKKADAIDCLHFVCVPQCRKYAQEEIKKIPAADVQPVRHGWWDVSYMDDFLVCSECARYWIYKGDQYDYHYCPNCGARMDKED